MKKHIILITTAIFIISACKKKIDFDNYHPKVSTTSVEILNNGDVLVTGEIISEGNTQIITAGFCTDTLPNPSILSNQQSIDTLFGNTFRYVYSGLDGSQKHYFKAWAANEEGYAYGEDVYIDSIIIQNSSTPCTPPLDSIVYSHSQRTKKESYSSISKVLPQSGKWEINLKTSTRNIYYTFSSKPINGVYKTFSNTDGSKLVTIRDEGYLVESGADVYVRQLNSTEVEISICSAKIYNGVFTDSMTTRFIAMY